MALAAIITLRFDSLLSYFNPLCSLTVAAPLYTVFYSWYGLLCDCHWLFYALEIHIRPTISSFSYSLPPLPLFTVVTVIWL